MTTDDRTSPPWPKAPAKNSSGEFIFLAVDVIEHSKLFRDDMPVREQRAIYKALKLYDRRASRSEEPVIARRTLDSSLDRTRVIFEGWMLQWECALFISEQGQDVPAYVSECLGVTSKSVRQDVT